MKRIAQMIFAPTVAFCLGILVSTALATGPWQVYFNESPSKMQVQELDSGPTVAVHFPVPTKGSSETYGVRLRTEAENGRVWIDRIKRAPTVRARGDCPQCEGSKDCQDCYPAGSGESTSGGECYSCNATGDCGYCEGSGVCYTCDGHGFENGCNTCGEVSG